MSSSHPELKGNINSKCHGSSAGVQNQGGIVIERPSVFAIYWGDWFKLTPGIKTKLDKFFTDILSSAYMDGLAQYGVHRGRLLGSVVIERAPWWCGTFLERGKLSWNLVGTSEEFGNIADGRPIWIADFTGNGREDVLFYYPGDGNWWLGTIGANNQLVWSLAGNTNNFGQVGDGRPIWVADFTGDGRADVLFYYPGDGNWWLGTMEPNKQLAWSLAGNTNNFGQVGDGRPIWVADFTGDGRADVLFYYPGDGNWWLGTMEPNKQLLWSLAGNTSGHGINQPNFGDISDGRPVFVGPFTHAKPAQMLFTYPAGPSMDQLDGDAVESQLVAWFDFGLVPQPPQTDDPRVGPLYVVFTPQGVSIKSNGDTTETGLGGFHKWRPSFPPHPPGSSQFVYAVVGWSSNINSLTLLASHEMVEALTDPTGSGFFGSNGCEVSDICELGTITVRGWTVEPYWSNADSKCIPTGNLN
jgi:hypothetical protein